MLLLQRRFAELEAGRWAVAWTCQVVSDLWVPPAAERSWIHPQYCGTISEHQQTKTDCSGTGRSSPSTSVGVSFVFKLHFCFFQLIWKLSVSAVLLWLDLWNCWLFTGQQAIYRATRVSRACLRRLIWFEQSQAHMTETWINSIVGKYLRHKFVCVQFTGLQEMIHVCSSDQISDWSHWLSFFFATHRKCENCTSAPAKWYVFQLVKCWSHALSYLFVVLSCSILTAVPVSLVGDTWLL